jgi:hypothetical protein
MYMLMLRLAKKGTVVSRRRQKRDTLRMISDCWKIATSWSQNLGKHF